MGTTNAARSLRALIAALVVAAATALCVALPGQAWADAYAVSDDAGLAAAIAAGETDIKLEPGTYHAPAAAKGKTLTISGSKEAVLEVVPAGSGEANGQLDYSFDGSTVTFSGITIKTNNQTYAGYARLTGVYNDCIFENHYSLQRDSEFNRCVFNVSGDQYNVWTWGAPNATFNDCTFNSDGKALMLYGTADTKLTVSNCTFNDKGGLPDLKAAIEIGNDYGKSYELNVSNTTVNGYEINDKGTNTGTTLWANKSSMDGNHLKVVVDNEQTYPIVVAKIGDTGYTSLQEALDAAAAGSGEVTVEILKDVDLNGVDWNPVTVSGPGYPKVTVNGNNHVITHLNDMLFAGTWAGGSGLVINDLTIKDSNIVNDEDDAKGTVGVGAFIGFPQASAIVALNNCHLVDSSVKGGHWTGGLIGYAAGYAGNDGPVFMNLTIAGCSVVNSTISGKGSAGGVIGHGSGNGWTNLVIEDTVVSGNTISSTGSSTNKAGSIMGTLGAAGQPTTAAGETKTGGAFVSATVSGNNVTSNGTAITTIYGRQGTATGVLTMAKGGSYDSEPINESDSWAKPAEGHMVTKLSNGTWSVLPEECTVTFVTNGGSQVDAETVAGGKPFAKPADPMRDGCTFAGWFVDEALTQEYDFDAPATGDITLHAKWTENSVPGGSGGEGGVGDDPTQPGGSVEGDGASDGKGESQGKTETVKMTSKGETLAKTGDGLGMAAAGTAALLAAAFAAVLIARRKLA